MKKQEKSRLSAKKLKWVIITLFITGLLIFCYPFVVSFVNNQLDQIRIERFQQKMNQTNGQVRQKRLQALKKRNQALKDLGGVPKQGEDPLTATVAKNDLNRQYFEERLLGSLSIPKIKSQLPLFDRTNPELLEKGVTLLQGTSYPIGGQDTHSVIMGHNGLPNRVLLTKLNQLKKGDRFYIEVLGKQLAYQVKTKRIVKPSNLKGLEVQPGQDLVTLVTCTPYTVNSHRLLVTGYRVPLKQPTPNQTKQTTKNQQWYWLLGSVSIGALVIGGGSLIWRRRR